VKNVKSLKQKMKRKKKGERGVPVKGCWVLKRSSP
jgi:hypothetical protein